MEENWMNKLIELLNEYVKQLWIWDYVWWHNEKTVRNSDYFLTKKFWFIKWLVDNNKIDKEKVWKNESPDIFDYSFYEVVLMLLSIQENPISFLIDILK